MSDFSEAARAFGVQSFCRLAGALEARQVASLQSAIDDLDARALDRLLAASSPRDERPDDLIVVAERDSPSEVCRYEAIAAASPILNALFVEDVAGIVAAVLGESVCLFKDKMNRKGPGGGAFPPHQDFAAYRHFPPRYNITALIPIDAMTLQNGCVQFATNAAAVAEAMGDQIDARFDGRPLFRTHGPGPRNGDIVDPVADALAWQPVEAAIGDIVLFDSFVPHFSTRNDSDTTRRALFITYNRAAEGAWYASYYDKKRSDRLNPIFHVSTPTVHRGEG